MVGNDEQGLLTKAQSLALHGGGYHFKGLACTNHMGKECITAIKDMGDGIDLMGSQFDLRVHANKVQVTAIVLTGTDGVELLVVKLA